MCLPLPGARPRTARGVFPQSDKDTRAGTAAPPAPWLRDRSSSLHVNRSPGGGGLSRREPHSVRRGTPSVWPCRGSRWQGWQRWCWEVTVRILSGLNKETGTERRCQWSLQGHPPGTPVGGSEDGAGPAAATASWTSASSCPCAGPGRMTAPAPAVGPAGSCSGRSRWQPLRPGKQRRGSVTAVSPVLTGCLQPRASRGQVTPTHGGGGLLQDAQRRLTTVPISRPAQALTLSQTRPGPRADVITPHWQPGGCVCSRPAASRGAHPRPLCHF